jgi:transposase
MPYPHKFIKLTQEEQWLVSAHLQRLAREGKDRERKRLQVVFLSNQGLTFRQIMKRLGMCYRTVKNCVYIWKKEGLSSPYFMGKPKP